MKLSEQVCTREQAEQLKELGIRQDSYFSWCGDKTKRLMDDGAQGMHYGDWVFVNTTLPCNNQEEDHRDMVPSAKPFAAAFTVAELGVMLPLGYSVRTREFNHKDWLCFDADGDTVIVDGTMSYKTEAEAKAELLLYAIERGSTTPEQINNRLND